MRVGRISIIQSMTHRDARALLKMFSIKGVSTASRRELSDIQSITPKNENDLKEKMKARKMLNSMVLDSTRDSMLKETENDDSILADRQRLDIIKNMEKAKDGVKISSLDMLAKTQVNSSILKSMNKTNEEFTNKNQVDSYKEDKNEINKPVEQKSILDEYSQLLKTLEQKRKKEKELEANKKDKDTEVDKFRYDKKEQKSV